MNDSVADPVVIVSAARTPMAAFQGDFASVTAPQLGSVAIRAAVERAGLKPEQIEEAVMGCVLPAGLGQAPARQAALGAGLPLSTGSTTINKMCGSGMRAAMFAHDMLLAGSADVIVAGGMESMTNAPYLLPKARGGMRMGHGQVLDHMFLDGLEDAYEKGRLMGTFAEQCAGSYTFTREAQDAFAIESLKRAKRANEDGSFGWEIAPVTVSGRKGDTVIDHDEQREDLNAQADLREGRHGDGGECIVHFRWRRRPGDDARIHSQTARRHAARARGRAQHVCTGTGVVHHGARWRNPQTVREKRLARE
jgi:acetyl-CoA C-acetyltransferase